jgi:LysM repeat protein
VRPQWIRLLTLALASSASIASANPRVHVVAAGESLELLARRYGTSAEAIRALNRIEGDVIHAGQELRIDPADGLHYTTVPGDTLSCLALRHGLTVEQLQADNPGLGPGRVVAGRTLFLRGAQRTGRVRREGAETLESLLARVGVTRDELASANPGVDLDRLTPDAELVVPAVRSVVHEVRRGESLARIATRYRVSVPRLLEWNPRVDARRLRAGTRLEVRRGTNSESVGSPTCGSIEGPVQIAAHRGYVLRNPERSWATERTASRLAEGFDAVLRSHRRPARVRVHDLSLRGGGSIDDHRSHQSGRDVDITYYQRRCDAAEGCALRAVAPNELDVVRQWTLLRHWLRRGDVEAVFIDYALQAPLYREAQRRGATPEELARWFQYPRRGHEDGIIRHFPNHRDHLHVRFACHESERRCR